MPPRPSQGRFVRRTDAAGRTYYQDRATGHRASKRAWTLDRERVRAGVPQAPERPKGRPFAPIDAPERPREGGGGGGGGGRDVEPYGHRGGEAPFPPGVAKEPGVPDRGEDFGEDEGDWPDWAVDGEEDYEET